MLYELKRGNLTIKADTSGAELHSIQLNGLEYLWQCGDAWKRYAPILFPFICSPENNRYYADGKEYHMKANHGFARDLEFETLEITEDSILFVLQSNPETLAQYPYHFRFIVRYRILDNGVEILHTVENSDSKPMYFYIGGHPAFNCPLEPEKGECFTDYYIEYNCEESAKNNNHETVLDHEKILNLSRNLFDYDSIVMPDPASDEITLKSRKSEHAVMVKFPESKCMTIWSPTGDERAKFVCLEPWTSVPTYFDDATPDLEQKAHAIRLDPGCVYNYCYKIFVR